MPRLSARITGPKLEKPSESPGKGIYSAGKKKNTKPRLEKCYNLEKVATKTKIKMDHKIKNYLGLAGIIGILLAALVAWQFAAAYADSVQPGAYRSFSVMGEGKTVAIPDIATFTFSVISEGGKDLGTLQTQNTNYANSVIEYVKGQGVESKDIKTEGYNVSPRYQYSNCGLTLYGGSSTCPPPTIVGYTVTQTVAVKVRDLAKAGEIIGGVVNAGANSVSQLQFTLDNPDAAKASAMADAMAKARAKAEAVTRAGGFGLGKLISVQINESGQYPMYYGMGGGVSAAKEMAAPAPAIEAGSQDVTVSVNMVYEIR